MDIKTLLETFSHVFTLWVIFPAIISIGLYFSFKLRFIQLCKLKSSFYCLTRKSESAEGNITRFEAISAVLAGNFGTGNISGMAIAIATGGPGALVWMWIMAFLGAVIQYSSCVLGVAYRRKTRSEYVGGPMYYLKEGLGYRKLAALFALFTMFGAVSVGNFAQINSIILPMEKMGFHPLLCSLGIAFLVGIVVLGGIKRLGYFASIIVPFKALLYLITAGIIITLHYDQILPAFRLMFSHAFGFTQLAGGLMGIGVLKAITTGFDRGLFATDAGTGIVPILQSGAKSDNAIIDGIATLLAPLMVMVVCTATGLVLILTGAWEHTELQSTNMVTFAFTEGLGHDIGGYVVMIALVLFAYTTILAWSYCGEKALEYLVGSKCGRWFQIVFIALIPISTMLQVSMIWVLADIAICGMLLINLIGVCGLSKHVIHATKEYRKESKIIRSEFLNTL